MQNTKFNQAYIVVAYVKGLALAPILDRVDLIWIGII